MAISEPFRFADAVGAFTHDGPFQSVDAGVCTHGKPFKLVDADVLDQTFPSQCSSVHVTLGTVDICREFIVHHVRHFVVRKSLV